ncbi:hypothetical protein GCM10009599_17340 [Luteococcus peritonei]
MLKQRVTLTGWSSAGRASTVVITGQVNAHGASSKASARLGKPLPSPKPTKPAPKPTKPKPTTPPKPTPTPTPEPTPTPAPTPTRQPIGPLVTIGSWNGRPVQLASGNGANEVWYAGKAVDAIAGTIWHSSVDGPVVHLWTQDETLHHWQLDLATGATSTSDLAYSRLVKEGGPGFWVTRSELQSNGTQWVATLYTWSGTKVLDLPSIYADRGRVAGFTVNEAVVIDARQTPSYVALVPVDGRAPYAVQVPGFIWQWPSDATGVTVTTNLDEKCRIEYGSTTCSGATVIAWP